MTIPDQSARSKDEIEPFAAHLAHDFNNLLTGILGNLELLQLRAARTGAAGLEGYIEGARQAGERAAELAHRLFIFSGQGTQAPQAVKLADVLRDLSALPEAQGFALGLPDAPPEVRVDPAELLVALRELLHNAREAGAAHVAISAQMTARQVSLSLQDDGRGMAPEILARAEELFFTSATNGAGRGLGLGIVSRIAVRAGGRMELESKPGQGSIARLILPAA